MRCAGATARRGRGMVYTSGTVSCSMTGRVSGLTPRHHENACAACSTSMPTPSATRRTPALWARRREGVNPFPYKLVGEAIRSEDVGIERRQFAAQAPCACSSVPCRFSCRSCQLGFGLDPFAAGLLVVALFAGYLGIKPLTTLVLKRFGELDEFGQQRLGTPIIGHAVEGQTQRRRCPMPARSARPTSCGSTAIPLNRPRLSAIAARRQRLSSP
jgi:hypothetical protein